MTKKWGLWVLGCIGIFNFAFFFGNGTFFRHPSSKQFQLSSQISDHKKDGLIEKYPHSTPASPIRTYQTKHLGFDALSSKKNRLSDKSLKPFSKEEAKDLQNANNIQLSPLEENKKTPAQMKTPSSPSPLTEEESPSYKIAHLSSQLGAFFKEGKRPEVFFKLQFLNKGQLDLIKGSSLLTLSSLFYHPEKKVFYALSIDSKNKNFPQVFELRLMENTYSKNRYYFKTDVSFSLFKKNAPQGALNSSLEGMVFLNPDEFFVNQKGLYFEDSYIPSSILKFSIEKGFQQAIDLPSMFYSHVDENSASPYIKSGVYKNKGLNALSSQYGSEYIWLSTERALVQDQFLSQNDKRTQNPLLNTLQKNFKSTQQFIRFTQIRAPAGEPLSQFIYPMESIIKEKNNEAKNTVVDFIVLGEKKLLVMEKANFFPNTTDFENNNPNDNEEGAPNSKVSLYLTDCSGASNVLSYKSLQRGNFILCGKRKIENVFKALENPQLNRLENLAKGPQISPHEWIIVFMDKTSSLSQKTNFFIYRYKEN